MGRAGYEATCVYMTAVVYTQVASYPGLSMFVQRFTHGKVWVRGYTQAFYSVYINQLAAQQIALAIIILSSPYAVFTIHSRPLYIIIYYHHHSVYVGVDCT